MKWYFFMVLMVLISCKDNQQSQSATKEESEEYVAVANHDTVQSYNYSGFKDFLEKDNDKVQVINFWATWCKPCVDELPYFEMINAQYSKDDVEVTLVSLDMPSMLDSHVIPFLKKRNIGSKVILLDDPDSNYWIPQIDKSWTGAIPATIIYKGDKRKFYEKTFTFNELQKELKEFL